MQKIIQKFQNNLDNPKVKDAVKNRVVLFRYAALAYITYKLVQYFIKRSKQQRDYQRWDKVCVNKKSQRDAQIEAFKNNQLIHFKLDESTKNQIINANITQLKKMLYDGVVTIKQVVLTYIERTVKYAPLHNWLADVCFEDALTLANQQDIQVKANRDILYAEGNDLFGIPISVKDMFVMKGYDTTFGLASRCFQPDLYDGNQIYMIKKAGGIIFTKTNNPQIGLTFETNNHIYGRGLNAHNRDYITGGSTGGEGGLLSAKCSLIGIGSDIGGSIRFPAGFNGVYGYKPSSKRICVPGDKVLHASYQGDKSLICSNGPLGRNVDDLAIFFKVMLDEKAYNDAPLESKDIYFKPRGFDQKLYESRPKVTIGYFKSFRSIPSCAANQRAIDISIAALQKQGYNLIPVDLNDALCEQALQLALTFCMADGLKTPLLILEGERHIVEYEDLLVLKDTPKPVLKLVHKILKVLNLHRLAFALQPLISHMSAYDYLCHSGKQIVLQAQMINLWETNQIQAMLTPLNAGVALKHGLTKDCTMTLIYAMIWNLFDYGAGVVPITTVQENEQHYNVVDTFSRADRCSAALNESLSTAKGLPVCVQIITRPLQDELCLSIMKSLQEEVGFVANPPLN